MTQVLVPRTDIGMAHGYKLKRRKAKDINNTSHGETSNVLRLLSDVSVDYMPDPNTLVSLVVLQCKPVFLVSRLVLYLLQLVN